MAKGFKHGGGGAPTTGIPEYTYTGVSQFVSESGKNWHLKLFTSGTLNFSKLKSATDIEICLVGGGMNGSFGQGGQGGAVVNKSASLKSDTDYAVTIGAAHGETSAFGYSAAPGRGSSGGSWGVNGTDGTHAFNDPFYTRYGPGGGGGAPILSNPTSAGTPGRGGDYGGGNGGECYLPGGAAVANTGGGGGGGGDGAGSPGGAGASGIVIIRNRR